MSGVSLLELDSESLIDVLHYMFEDDVITPTPELAELRDKARIRIYEDLYGTTYDYATPANRQATVNPIDMPFDDGTSWDDKEEQPEGMKKATKAYVPTTDFNPNATNPYHGILDTPLA